jgi:16S rRNA (adenine1518-N6/adenine1519-N6)-dimethyltransferase
MIPAKKSLGQHFLRDPNITDKIVRLCGDLSALNIVEIGPGPGALTRSILAAKPLSYTGIEKDERCLPLLQALGAQHAAPSSFLHADALKTPLTELTPAPRAIIANLPYNVGTEMLIHWLHDISGAMGGQESDNFSARERLGSLRGAVGAAQGQSKDPTEHGEARSVGESEARGSIPPYHYMTLMFQKEVVNRLVAQPSTKDYGRLTILTQWLCEAEALFDLPPSAFSPPPKVTSTVVKLTPRANPAPCILPNLEKLTGAAFGQRRKMLRVSLKPLGGEALLEKAGITPTLRAENLTVAEFVKLANLLT